MSTFDVGHCRTLPARCDVPEVQALNVFQPASLQMMASWWNLLCSSLKCLQNRLNRRSVRMYSLHPGHCCLRHPIEWAYWNIRRQPGKCHARTTESARKVSDSHSSNDSMSTHNHSESVLPTAPSDTAVRRSSFSLAASLAHVKMKNDFVDHIMWLTHCCSVRAPSQHRFACPLGSGRPTNALRQTLNGNHFRSMHPIIDFEF